MKLTFLIFFQGFDFWSRSRILSLEIPFAKSLNFHAAYFRSLKRYFLMNRLKISNHFVYIKDQGPSRGTIWNTLCWKPRILFPSFNALCVEGQRSAPSIIQYTLCGRLRIGSFHYLTHFILNNKDRLLWLSKAL